ncbi:MAG: hypothetical protein FJX77_04955 [Armatimonadetes bacterium]|nr:hypothetical protein [Armatimonadota bacterium]
MQWLPKDPDLNRVAFLVRVLATLPSFDVSRVMRDGGQRAFDQRERLSAYSQALLAIGFHHARRRAEAELLLRNLENTVRVDRENGQAF